MHQVEVLRAQTDLQGAELRGELEAAFHEMETGNVIRSVIIL
ncbi:MAG: hypothetical protein WD716_13560 [Fimbriimonadaceae bacterium]